MFNSILGYDKAIVSNIKGTTRDTIEAFVEIDRYPVVLSDTAGHHKTKNSLDLKGVKKTEEAINKADIILAIDEKDPDSFIKSFNIKNKPIIKVVSKIDLLKRVPKKKGLVCVSSLENINIDFLLTELSTLIRESFFDGVSFFVPERQLVLLKRVQRSLSSLLSGFDGLDVVEIAAVLRGSVESLQEVFGEIYNEDVFNDIFKGFCVGK